MSTNESAQVTAIVTGGARGLGLCTAKALGRDGARVAIFDVNEENLAAAAAELAALGIDAITRVVDITDADAVDRVVDDVASVWGELDILVNNAAIHELVDVADLSAAKFTRMLDINVVGTFNVTQAALRHMVKQGKGSIVSVASIAGLRGHPVDKDHHGGASHYAASKGAVIAFTRSVAKELGYLGIRANCVAPGMMATPMNAASYSSADASGYAATVPLGRIGQPEEVAEAVAFLASARASYITGQVLNVCGGAMTS
jgi:3-oxoacyl-[acyl-carrier protein] reductase